METTFKYKMGEQVKLESGLIGTVEGNSVIRGYTLNRIFVIYYDNSGARQEIWIDEDRLTPIVQ